MSFYAFRASIERTSNKISTVMERHHRFDCFVEKLQGVPKPPLAKLQFILQAQTSSRTDKQYALVHLAICAVDGHYLEALRALEQTLFNDEEVRGFLVLAKAHCRLLSQSRPFYDETF